MYPNQSVVPIQAGVIARDIDYKARAKQIQLNNAEINTLKWKLHAVLVLKLVNHEGSIEQLSDDHQNDIVSLLHLSLEPHYCQALTMAGFNARPSDSPQTLDPDARKKVEALRTSLGINGVHLMKMTFSEAHLSGIPEQLKESFFSNSILKKVDFSGSDLSGSYLNWADLGGAILRGTILRNIVLYGAILRGAILDDAVITLQLPENWDGDFLETQLNHLNHLNKGRSLLTAIDSIDDGYAALKIDLMHQVIDSLDQQNVDISTVSEALLAIWTNNSIYMEDEKTTSFIARKCKKEQ